MLHYVKKPSILDTAISNYFSAFKSDIVALHQTQWNSEDLKGKSKSQWMVMQYYNLMYLLILVHKEVTRTKHLDYSWSYYEQKFNLVAVRECMGCYGINWNKAIEAFDLNNLVPGGIEDMSLEETFIIYGEEKAKSDVTFVNLIAYPNVCVNYIKEAGVDPIDVEHQDTSYFDTIQDTIDNNLGAVSDEDV